MTPLSPESIEATTRYMLENTLRAMAPLHLALAKVEDDRLDEQPVPEQLPIGKMLEHAFGAVAFTSRALRLGKCDEADVGDLMTDTEATGTRPRILEVAEMARAELEATLARLDAEMALDTIDYWFGWSLTGLQTASLGYEEICHHRGQVQSFLRLMGYRPPDIYAPAEAAEEALAE